MIRPVLIAALLLAAPSGAGEIEGAARLGPSPDPSPARVVTLAPSLTETVLALGEGERLVGVTRYDTFPEVKSLPRIGGYLDPNLEAILGLEPDLLLVEKSPGNEEVAGALDAEARGRRLVAEIDRVLATVRKQAASRPPRRTLLVYGHQPLVVAGPGSYAGELLAIAGGRNVVTRDDTGVAYPTWPLEKVITARPEVILDLVAGHRADALTLPGVDARVVPVDSDALMRPGPSIGRGVVELFGLLHPDAKPELTRALAEKKGGR